MKSSEQKTANRKQKPRSLKPKIHDSIRQSADKIQATRKRVAVICDMDETIYPGATAKDAGRWLLKHGYLGPTIYLKIIWWMVLRKLHLLNHEGAFAEAVAHLRGYKIGHLEKIMGELYREDLAQRISPAVRALVKQWERHGDLAFATESLAVIATPMAADLGGQTVLGTELEVRDGVVTGKLGGPVLRDEAKARAIVHWAAENDYDLTKSIGVGGRPEDASLLELVGHPVMLNPDAAARKLAQQKGWEIIDTQRRMPNS